MEKYGNPWRCLCSSLGSGPLSFNPEYEGLASILFVAIAGAFQRGTPGVTDLFNARPLEVL